MIPAVSPNRVVAAAVALFVTYWVLAMFLPAVVLRDFFNSLAFGTQVVVVATWAPAAYRAVRENAADGSWLLILAIWFINFVAMLQRIYAIAFNAMGRPESWAFSSVSGFWPYSYMLTGLLFLVSPGVKGASVQVKTWWMMLLAVALGSFVAGGVFFTSISTF